MTIQLGDAAANPFLTDVVTQGSALGSLNAAVSLQLRGQASACFQITAIGSQTLTFEGSVDGSNFFSVQAYPIGGGAAVTTTTTTGQWAVDCAGFFIVRLRVSTQTSGSATVSGVASQGGDVVQAIDAVGTARNNLVAVAGTALGTPTNFGTSPGAVVAESVNSSVFVGTTVAVASSAGVQKVGIAGGAAGAAIDGAIAAAPPANALQIGIKAATANPANATAGNQVAIMGDKAGRQVITTGQVRDLVGVTTAQLTTTTETTIVAAGGAGVFNDISHIDISMTTGGTPGNATVTIKDATAGTTRAIYFLPTTSATLAYSISIDFPIPMTQAAANANWTATSSSATAVININTVFIKNT